MSGLSHVTHTEIKASIIIYVSKVTTHCKPTGVWQYVRFNIGEGAVPIIFVQAVGSFEIISYVEIKLTIIIEIQPD